LTLAQEKRAYQQPLALPSVFRYFPPAVAEVYIVSFCTHGDIGLRECSNRFVPSVPATVLNELVESVLNA
jgi:hypothetical protein